LLKKTWIVIASLTIVLALSMGWAATVTKFSFFSTVRDAQNSFHTVTLPPKADDTALGAPPCMNALAQRAVCVAANKRAFEIMSAHQGEAVTVVQDVLTGAVVAFAASRPADLDVSTSVSPLSLSKLLLSASWWDNRQPDTDFDSTRGTPNAQNPAYRSRVSIHEMLVGGSDSAGRQMAVALRKSVGAKAVLEDFKRYGFGQPTNSPRDDTFWKELVPTWKTRLLPAQAYVSLSDKTKDEEWAEALSIGEIDMKVTALHVSRFLQAIGNNGMMAPPVAREEQSTPAVTTAPVPGLQLKNPIRIMKESTALRLQSAMRDTVHRGTAKSIAQALEGTGWQIGGKTGSGTAMLPKGAQVDGWFAGLIFDSQGKARFTVATFVRSGGYGGEKAAKISAELAVYLIAGS
jgi:membrane peptidoglycan carboxypeptidase